MLTLVFRSLFRHKVRAGLTLAVIMFGVVSLMLSGGFIEDIFIQLREATIHSRLGHIQVYRAEYTTIGRRNPYEFLLSDSGSLVRELAAESHVSDVMVRLNFSGLINNGHADLPIIGEGIEPDSEKRMGSVLSINSGRHLGSEDSYGIIVGKGVAKALQLEPGAYVSLIVNTPEGALNILEFEVVGVFSTFARDYDNRAVRIPLIAAQELLATQGVHSLVFLLDETASTDMVAGDLKNRLPADEFEVKTWYELADFYNSMVNHYRGQFLIIQAIILIMVLLSVANTINMAVYERIGEFGTLMALGARRKDIFWQVIRENVLLGIIGSSVGIFLGIIFAWAISGIGIEMPPPPNADTGYTAYIRLVPWVMLVAFIIGLVATVLAAMLPAYRVSRLAVADALRENV